MGFKNIFLHPICLSFFFLQEYSVISFAWHLKLNLACEHLKQVVSLHM